MLVAAYLAIESVDVFDWFHDGSPNPRLESLPILNHRLVQNEPEKHRMQSYIAGIKVDKGGTPLSWLK